MDTVSRKKRSEIMRAVKRNGTEIEKVLWEKLNSRKYKYQKNVEKMAGKPDIVFKRNNIVIFLDSCFWHGCRWHCRLPKTHRAYWTEKIERNKKRDKKINAFYKQRGWKALRFWEHELKNQSNKIFQEIDRHIRIS